LGGPFLRKDETMTPEQIKHLDYIQAVITRMNANSFQLKGWTVTLVSALLALSASAKNQYFVLVAILPTLIFWALDAYYLQQERKFRGVYNDVTGLTKQNKIELFAMPIQLYKGDSYSYWNVFGSKTIAALYLPLILILVVIYALM
jgi:hypothetical protein